jgi:hypothetical protein
MKNFIYGIKSQESRKEYPSRLRIYFDFLELPGLLDEQADAFIKKAKENGISWVRQSIIDFVTHYRKRVEEVKNLSAGTMHNYFDAAEKFVICNDEITPGAETIMWDRIKRGLPEKNNHANDRAPTKEELRKLVRYPDQRIKAIVCVMASSGIRLQAWDYLKWKHVTPITNAEYLRKKKRQEELEKKQPSSSNNNNIVITKEDEEKIVAAKLIVYAGDGAQYYTFITPEAYHELKIYMAFREKHGEEINVESPIMRDTFPTTNVKNSARRALAKYPKRLKSSGIKKLLHRALWEQGIREPLAEGQRRHEFKAAHGLRKFFDTCLENARVKQLNVALLISHKTGMADHYRRPIEETVLEDYLNAVDLLTIGHDDDNDNSKSSMLLQKEVVELREKSKEENYNIKGWLAEREEEIEEVKARMEILQANTSNLFKLFIQQNAFTDVEGENGELILYAWDKENGPIETAKMIKEQQQQQLQKEKEAQQA